jgi:hypothetical protein
MISGIGIEQERERACLSRKVITHLGLSARIQIIEGNHFILPLESSCELYIVAAQADPKKEIFEPPCKSPSRGEQNLLPFIRKRSSKTAGLQFSL